MATKKKILKPKKSQDFFQIPDLSDELSIICDKINDFTTMDVQQSHLIVPTIFTSFNRAIQIGGAPTGCLWLVYGPWGQGKTAFTLGMIISFLISGNPALFIDAEHAADTQNWFKALGGSGLLRNCLYYKPKSYEDTVERVFTAINNFNNAKLEGKIAPDKCFIIVLDSINKLVPENELADLLKIGKGYPIRALFNSLFTDKLTPVVGSSNVAFVMIAQEREKLDAQVFERASRVKGGEAIKFDSSVMVRVTRGESIKEQKGTGKSAKKFVTGYKHNAVIEKNKVGPCFEHFNFFTSNGKGSVPLGFDTAREVTEEGILRKVIAKSGTSYFLPNTVPVNDDNMKFVGKENVMQYLRENPEQLHAMIHYMNEQTAALVEDQEDLEDD